jgi:CDP-diacylglycerol--serine O-phosphatidyltransferase
LIGSTLRMSKLTVENKFIDVSDYGRPAARVIVQLLKSSKVTAVHLTLLFGLSGMIAIYCMGVQQYWTAGFFLVLKSILDAADGQLARTKNQPSYIGRYLDSILDSLLNLALIISIASFTHTNIGWAILAYICLQTQGTVYNYYHVILRHSTDGEITSQIFENQVPKAYPEENQAMVNILFKLFRLLYKVFDEFVYALDPHASKASVSPKWFMFLVSFYGLGFQLLLMAFFLVMGWIDYIIPFFIAYSMFIPILIGTRRVLLK